MEGAFRSTKRKLYEKLVTNCAINEVGTKRPYSGGWGASDTFRVWSITLSNRIRGVDLIMSQILCNKKVVLELCKRERERERERNYRTAMTRKQFKKQRRGKETEIRSGAHTHSPKPKAFVWSFLSRQS
ncbi:unnamed protein product [Ilex paraguariensis]|uniref:Uncharacterized protein n=1 Tax=Ilex paraguariensis TaxID=185542 RepID=A0ABC8TGB8_9AQUA